MEVDDVALQNHSALKCLKAKITIAFANVDDANINCYVKLHAKKHAVTKPNVVRCGKLTSLIVVVAQANSNDLQHIASKPSSDRHSKSTFHSSPNLMLPASVAG